MMRRRSALHRAKRRARSAGIGPNLMAPWWSSSGPCSCAGWSPADLPLTGWWRADYTDVGTWTGTASTGTSGANDLVAIAGYRFDEGAAVNGFVPSHNDGRDRFEAPPFTADPPVMYMNADGTLDTYLAATQFSGWALFKVDNLDEPRFIWHSETGAGDQFQLYVGGTMLASAVELVIGPGAGTVVINRAAGAGATWVCVTFRYDGVDIHIGVNEIPGAGFPADTECENAFTGSVVLTGGLKCGTWSDLFRIHTFEGDLLDVGLTDAVMTDDEFCKLICHLRDRYNLPLVAPP